MSQKILFLRHLLEFFMLIPACCFATLPVQDSFRFSRKTTFMSMAAAILLFSLCGASFCSRLEIPTNTVLMPGLILFFLLYMFFVTEEFGKKMFCFANAAMMGAFASTYTGCLTADIELRQEYTQAFSVRSGLIALGLNLLLGIVFFRTLRVKIPRILRDERLERLWKWLPMIPVTLTCILYWASPENPELVKIGKIQMVALVLLALVPIAAYVLYDVFWQVVILLTESETLARQNTFLQMERRRYEYFRKVIDDTRTARHDFRQHIRVISRLASDGDTEGILEYVSPLENRIDRVVRYSANGAVDALAAYYAEQAEAAGAEIAWSISLPEQLPMEEAEYCPLLGNLLENALEAVKFLPPEERKIKVVTGMPSEGFLGITVENPYEGTITLKENGLPKTDRKGHGVGLESVANTVERHNGFLEVDTANHRFTVNILLNCASVYADA